MHRKAVFTGVVSGVLALGLLAPAAAKPEPAPVDPTNPTAVVPDPGAQALVAELEGGGFGSGSKWGVDDDLTACIDDFNNAGLGIQDASLNGPTFDDDDVPGSFDDTFDDALMAFVDGAPFEDTAPVTDDATFYNSGPFSLSGLDVRVGYRTFADQSAIRQLVTLTNPTGAPIAIQFGWGNNSGADDDTTVVGTGSGDTTVTVADSYATINDDGAADNDPVSTYVLFGTGAPLQPSGFGPDCDVLGDGSTGEENLGVLYAVTVPAGATVYLMFFAAIQPAGSEAAALAQAQELISLTCDSAKVADLEDTVKEAILNWNFDCVADLVVRFTG